MTKLQMLQELVKDQEDQVVQGVINIISDPTEWDVNGHYVTPVDFPQVKVTKEAYQNLRAHKVQYETALGTKDLVRVTFQLDTGKIEVDYFFSDKIPISPRTQVAMARLKVEIEDHLGI